MTPPPGWTPAPFRLIQQCQGWAEGENRQCHRSQRCHQHTDANTESHPAGARHVNRINYLLEHAEDHPFWDVLLEADHPIWQLEAGHPVWGLAADHPMWALPNDDPLWHHISVHHELVIQAVTSAQAAAQLRSDLQERERELAASAQTNARLRADLRTMEGGMNNEEAARMRALLQAAQNDHRVASADLIILRARVQMLEEEQRYS